jgi:putative FmdB family regulatory protein
MPMYDYKCPVCGAAREVILRLTELDQRVSCHRCPSAMNRLVSAAHIQPDYPAYRSPIDGRLIEGRKAHREDLARNGCRVFESGERESYIQRQKQLDDQLDRAVEDSVDATLANMTTDQRDAIGAALDNGLTPELVRQ